MNKKYNEIMNRLEMSDEMQSRVLADIDRHFKVKKRNKQLKIWLPIAGVAAAAAILLLVAKPWSGRKTTDTTEMNTGGTTEVTTEVTTGVQTGGYDPGTEQGTETQIANPMVEYKSPDALNKAAGFSMPELKSIPYDVTSRTYYLIDGTLAEINYEGTDASLSFRKSKGKEDNSGDYNDYPTEQSLKVSDISVTMKGEKDTVHLVLWTAAGYSYSIYTEQGITKDAAAKLVTEAMK